MKYITATDIVLKERSKDSHKGQSGKVMVIGGSEDYVGALALCGLAALRSGADYVTVACPEKVGWALNALTPDLVVKKVKGNHFTIRHTDKILEISDDYDAVLIGNGIGKKSDSFVRSLAKKLKKPLVIDAEAIKAISLDDLENAVITPHAGELKKFLSNSGIKEEDLQKNIKDNVVLKKGMVDKIISKDKVIYNKTGEERMAVAGTGDVLAGLTVGFLAQGYTKMESASYAAYINGKTGEQLKKKKGYSYIASDLVEDLKKLK